MHIDSKKKYKWSHNLSSGKGVSKKISSTDLLVVFDVEVVEVARWGKYEVTGYGGASNSPIGIEINRAAAPGASLAVVIARDTLRR